MAAWPAIKKYKEYTYRLLGEAGPALDVGSGPGTDLASLGPEAVGVDLSATMCRCALAPGSRLCQAAADALPIRTDSFSGCRTDRVLHRLRSPR